MSELRTLAYLVVAASDLDAWRAYASDIVGMGVCTPREDALGLRMDDEPWRILVERGSADDLTHAGWDVGTSDALDAYIDGLRNKGADVREESPDLAAARSVTRVFSLADPNGFTHEFFCGRIGQRNDGGALPAVVRGSGFHTGELGIGHILPVARDYEASVRWYEEVLGLKYTDRIRQQMAPGVYADATFFHAATGRHHSLATGAFPSRKRLNHIMLEFCDMNDVGAAFDRARAADVPIILELGHHPNDQMFSFYMVTPSGFGLELGFGGITVDDATWEPRVHDVMSDWGHKRNITTIA